MKTAVPVPEQGRSAVCGMSCGTPYSLNVNVGVVLDAGPSVATMRFAALPVNPVPAFSTTWTL